MKRLPFYILFVVLLSACTSDVPPDDGAIHVTSITLDKTSINIKEGESTLLTATILPLNADNKTVVWLSSSEETAIVNEGTVIGMSAGSAIITAMAEDNGKKATCAVTVERNLAPSVTVGANHLSAVSVILNGKANLGSSVAVDLRVGFQYSKSAGILPSNSTTIDAEDTDINYNYSSSVTGLDPGTTYYFRSFVRQNGTDVYGETKQFKTKELESLIQTKDATGVEASSATLNAMLDLTDVMFTDIEYGFYWGLSEEDLNTRLGGGQIDGQAVSAPMTSLQHKTKYWYKAYVKLDNLTFYGKVMNFTTDVIPVESVSLGMEEDAILAVYAIHNIGSSLSFQATIYPSDATDQRVSWASSDETVATVDENGKVTAIDNGTTTVTVTTIDQKKTASCEIKVKQHVTNIYLSEKKLHLFEREKYTFSAIISPEKAVDKSLVWSSSNNAIVTIDETGKITAISNGTAIITAQAHDGSGICASCEITVYGELVDLGLSVKWRGWNLGASKPGELGNYYAWGEIEQKSSYNWANYKWCNGSESTLTKYNTKSSYGRVDNKTHLEPEDDIAHVTLGGTWRVPTDVEWNELMNNCTWTWTRNYNKSNEVGMIVTSNMAGYTNKSIFLPALDYGMVLDGYGCYWSSSLHTESINASAVSIKPNDVTISSRKRCYSAYIRPVSD